MERVAVKIDRRIKKTKKQLSEGLIELLDEKNIKDITIKELVEKVDINRSTFYLHYSDIYELLAEIESNLMDEIWNVFDSYKAIENLEESYAFILTLYKTFERNRNLCRVLMSVQSTSNFINDMEESLEKEIRHKITTLLHGLNDLPDNYFVFYRCGCIGLLKYWITSNSSETPEKMAKETYHLVVDSLKRIEENKDILVSES